LKLNEEIGSTKQALDKASLDVQTLNLNLKKKEAQLLDLERNFEVNYLCFGFFICLFRI
jgi:hypothetical protein